MDFDAETRQYRECRNVAELDIGAMGRASVPIWGSYSEPREANELRDWSDITTRYNLGKRGFIRSCLRMMLMEKG